VNFLGGEEVGVENFTDFPISRFAGMNWFL
jgi:hypothetical protein